MITNGYPWMRLSSADMTEQEQVERTPGIPRNLMNYSYSLGILSFWFCVTPYKMVLTFKSVDAHLM